MNRAKVIAERTWCLYREGLWHRLLSRGELVWLADVGGTSYSWRVLPLDAYRDIDLAMKRSVRINEPPSVDLDLKSRVEILTELMSMETLVESNSRLAYDEGRLTFFSR